MQIVSVYIGAFTKKARMVGGKVGDLPGGEIGTSKPRVQNADLRVSCSDNIIVQAFFRGTGDLAVEVAGEGRGAPPLWKESEPASNLSRGSLTGAKYLRIGHFRSSSCYFLVCLRFPPFLKLIR